MTLPFSLLLAWRDGRREARRNVLHLVALALGVAAMVSLTALRMDVDEGIRAEGRTLLGADIRISSSTPFPKGIWTAVDSLGEAGAEASSSITFGTLVSAPGSGASRFLQVLTHSGGYPLYGAPRDDPAGSWAGLGPGRALVDPQVLDQLSIKLGDEIRLAERELRVVGVVEGLPMETGFRSALGPGIYVSQEDVDAARLLETGSVGQWRVDLRLPEGMDEGRVAEELRERLSGDLVGVSSASERAESLAEGLGFMGGFLGLVGLTALILGGIGVGSSTYAHLEEKVRAVAVLRSLGARERVVFSAFLLQAGGLAVLGSGFGVVVGLAVQRGGSTILSSLLGLDLPSAIRWEPVLSGFGIGIWFAFLFAAVPLLSVRGVAPLQVFQQGSGGGDGAARWSPATFGLLVGVSVLVGAIRAAPSVAVGVAYAVGFLAVCGLLLAVARLLVRLARRLVPESTPFAFRHGLSSLFRPRNQTGTAVLAIGVGVFLLTTMTIVERSFLERIALEEASGGANLFLFDIQRDQREAVAELVRGVTEEEVQFVPIVPARMAELRGRAVAELERDPELEIPGWTLRRLYRNTYREGLGGAEELLRGEWWSSDLGEENGGGRMEGAVARISVEQGLAGDLGIQLGDRIVWDVQGVPVSSRVANIRRVDWNRFEPNFFIVFEPGFLEDAPQSFLAAVQLDDPSDRALLQRWVAQGIPGVAVLDFTRIRETVDRIIARVGWGVRALSLFTLLAGGLVVAGVVGAMRRRRLQDAALLRTLGARGRTVLACLAGEHAALGLVTAAAGVAIGSGAAGLLLSLQFDLPMVLPLGQLALVGMGSVLLTVALGMVGAYSFLSRPPLPFLRRESQ